MRHIRVQSLSLERYTEKPHGRFRYKFETKIKVDLNKRKGPDLNGSGLDTWLTQVNAVSPYLTFGLCSCKSLHTAKQRRTEHYFYKNKFKKSTRCPLKIPPAASE